MRLAKVLTLIAGAALAYDGWAIATGRTRFNWVDTMSIILFVLLALFAGRQPSSKTSTAS